MRWTEELIDEKVDAFIEKYNRRPQYKEMGPSGGFDLPGPNTVKGHFGNVGEYFDSKGIDRNRVWWTYEKIIDAVKPHIDKKGSMLTYKEMRELSKASINFPSEVPIKKFFGDMEQLANVLEVKAGYIHWDFEKVADALYYKCEELGRFITDNDIREESIKDSTFPSGPTIMKYFPKGLQEVADYLGYKIRLQWTKETIAESMIELLVDNNMIMFSLEELKELKKMDIDIPGDETIRMMYGSIERFCDEMKIKKYPKTNVSQFEKNVVKYIRSFYTGAVITNRKSILGDGRELDIYLPDIGLALECNGDYWHSYNGPNALSKEYHLSKTTLAEVKDITLAHIWEHEWNTNQEEIKKYIKDFIAKKEIWVEEGEEIIMDRMKHRFYTNVEFVKFIDPALIEVGAEKCWDCGHVVYRGKKKLT